METMELAKSNCINTILKVNYTLRGGVKSPISFSDIYIKVPCGMLTSAFCKGFLFA